MASASGGGNTPSTAESASKQFPESLKRPWRKLPVLAKRTFLLLVIGVPRLPSVAAGTVFSVFLPLTPLVVFILKNHQYGRDALVQAAVMQALTYLNAEGKAWGKQVFIGYIIVQFVGALFQDWTMANSIPIQSFSALWGYIATTNLDPRQNHMMDTTLFLGIISMSVLTFLSVVDKYLLKGETHWYLLKTQSEDKKPKELKEAKLEEPKKVEDQSND